MNYLNDLCSYPDPTSKDTRDEVRTRVQDKFPHVDLGSSLDDAFRMWDAVSHCLYCQEAPLNLLTLTPALPSSGGGWR